MRQFGEDGQGIYKGKHLLCFVDNHDVTRIASILTNEKHLPLLYGALMGMPGIPCIYYGSEWGAKANKSEGDPALRPCFDTYVENELTETVAILTNIRQSEKALAYGSFRSAFLTNKQCVMERWFEEDRILVCINSEENDFDAYFDMKGNKFTDLITGETIEVNGPLHMKGYSMMFLKQV